jgi:hypothetical protein
VSEFLASISPHGNNIELLKDNIGRFKKLENIDFDLLQSLQDAHNKANSADAKSPAAD